MSGVPARRSVVLIGFMGTGKTSVGRRLAERLGFPFIDTDAEIELATGKTIPEIFALQGETAFRTLEAATVRRLSGAGPAVVATGGGVVLNPENVANLKRTGLVVLLEAPADEIYGRVKEEGWRPLLAVADPLERIRQLLVQREPLYRAAADMVVVAVGRTPDELAGEILDRMMLEEFREPNGASSGQPG